MKGKLLAAMLDGLLVSSRLKMCRLAVLLALAGIGVFPGSARALPNYFMRQWQNEDGLPQNGVTALVQTREGYIWVGTYSGLARFDGVQFEVFDSATTPELHSSRITSLFEDENGELWIGHETGDLTRYRNRHFEAIDLGPAWNGRKILALGSDARGDVWAQGSDGALARARDQKILPPAGPDAGSVALARDRQGTLWVLRDRALWRLIGENLEPVRLGTNSANPYVQGICASWDGGLWVVVDGQVRKWRNNSWAENLGPAPWGFGSAVAFTETRAGDLAAGIVDGGLNLLFKGGGSMCFTRTNGLPSDWVRALCEDREGDLWVGTGNGLVALRDGKVATLNPPDQWQGRAILSVSPAREGGLWVGTEGAGVYRYNAGRWTRHGAEEGLPNMFVWSVSEDSQGRLWAGTWGGGLVMQRSNRFEHVPGLEGVTVPILAVLHTDRGGWLGTGSGLAHYEHGETTWYGAAQGLSLPDVRAVVKDASGVVWFGMVGGGLGRLENGKVRQYKKADGLSSDFIQCLRGEPDGSLWIGTSGGGLNRFKNGKFSVVDTARGLRNNIICDIQDDQHGCYWVSSHGGILRIKKEELNECADGKIPAVECQIYDRGDGMPTLECTGGFQPAGCRTDDGRLWFPTSKGLVGVTPDVVKTNPWPPPVIIEQWLVNGKAVTNGLTGGGQVQLAPGQNQLEFSYTGLSFVAPEKVRFRYRLEGLGNDWFEASTKRTANYSYIPPGDYTFHVIACNNDGVWNETGAKVSFRLLPHFWQTWWFRALTSLIMVAVASGGVWYETRRRMRHKLERLERQHALEHERARIARDIHDDLGSHLTRITMLSESARGDLESSREAAAADLDGIYDTARELTRSMDEIVWAVNPKHDSLEGLVNYLEKFALDFLGVAGLRCRLDMPEHFPPWSLTSEIRHNLFLAFKEALNNIVKHASASEVKIALTLEAQGFCLGVEDNGCGFGAGTAANDGKAMPDRYARGNGLENMRLRLEEIGGSCELSSAPGKGTRVVFRVPLRRKLQVAS